MSAPQAFALTRASTADTHAITEVLYLSFDHFARENFFGIPTKSELSKLADSYAKTMATDPADVWIKVVDVSTGVVAAVSNWKAYIAPETAISRLQEEPKDWVHGEVLKRQRLLMEPMNAARTKANPGPFMYLHILATHPDYRRQGLGSMMMQWGVNFADSLCLPSWIEASPEGNFLYQRFGFEDYEEIRRDDDLLGRKGEVLGMNMRRSARRCPISTSQRGKS